MSALYEAASRAIPAASGIGIGVRGTGLRKLIEEFAVDPDGTARILRCSLSTLAAAIQRSQLEQRTSELLSEPIARICSLETQLESEVRTTEVSSIQARALLAAVLAWRQDFINAGRNGNHGAPRTSIWDPSGTGDYAGWFKQWASRNGRPTTVLYNAVVVLAALSSKPQ